MSLCLKTISKKWWAVGIALVALIGAGAWFYARAQKPPMLTTVTPHYQDLKATLDINGSLDASQKATLRFPASSKLTWVGVKTGDSVKAYQAIATVDTQILEKQLKQDLNSFEKQFRAHDQVLDDYDYYGTPDLNREVKRILENANFDLQNSVLAVEIRDLSIRLSTLTTPIAGIVTRVDTPFAGVYLSPSDVFQIVNPDSLYFSIVIDEEDIGLVKTGQHVEVTLDAFASERLVGTLKSIDFFPTTSASGSTAYAAYVHVPLDLTTGNYRLGLNGVAQVTVNEKKQAFTIPLDSLTEKEDGTYVTVLENGLPLDKKISLGIQTDEWVEVLAGLQPEDQVVVPKAEE